MSGKESSLGAAVHFSLGAKPHYAVLDGLRGMAAMLIVMFHLFETHARDFQFHTDQIINHGYLGVDFFFMLSGFVIGYAYDDRWGKMNVRGFFKRRLIRLQPMLVIGMLFGAGLLFFQVSDIFSNMGHFSVGAVVLVTILGSLLLPVPNSLDIRGWSEMYPLNGPSWSLFFEYIANILYATIVRKLSNKWLAVLVFVAGCALIHQCINHGNNAGGWTLTIPQFLVGMTRLTFPFFGGLLLYRLGKHAYIKHAFLWCSLIIVVALAMPHVGGADYFRLNGAYDAFCIILVFPLVVLWGASGGARGRFSAKCCHFLGNISYPIYITHYPIIYLYTMWVYNNDVSLKDALPITGLVLLSCVAISYAFLKLYDEPVRKCLTRWFAS